MQRNRRDNPNNVIPFDPETQGVEEFAQNLGQNLGDEIQIDAFDRLISQYYNAKSVEQDTSTLDFAQELERPSEDLAFDILTKQASFPRQVLLKLNILENELAMELDAGAPLSGKYLVMFAGLKADLIRVLAYVEAF